jgi:hypothetical protein
VYAKAFPSDGVSSDEEGDADLDERINELTEELADFVRGQNGALNGPPRGPATQLLSFSLRCLAESSPVSPKVRVCILASIVLRCKRSLQPLTLSLYLCRRPPPTKQEATPTRSFSTHCHIFSIVSPPAKVAAAIVPTNEQKRDDLGRVFKRCGTSLLGRSAVNRRAMPRPTVRWEHMMLSFDNKFVLLGVLLLLLLIVIFTLEYVTLGFVRVL